MITFIDPADGATGTVQDGEITCTNQVTQGLLQSAAKECATHGGLPDPDMELFQFLADRGPIKIVLKHADAAPARVAGRVY